jgi:hypothetical protein
VPQRCGGGLTHMQEEIPAGPPAAYTFVRYTGTVIGVFFGRQRMSSFAARMPAGFAEVDAGDDDVVGRRIMYRGYKARAANKWRPFIVEAQVPDQPGAYRVRPFAGPVGGEGEEPEEEDGEDDEEEDELPPRRTLRARAARQPPQDPDVRLLKRRVFHTSDDAWDDEPWGSWTCIEESADVDVVRESRVSVYYTFKTVFLNEHNAPVSSVEILGGVGTRGYMSRTLDAAPGAQPQQSRQVVGTTAGAPPPWFADRNVVRPWQALFPRGRRARAAGAAATAPADAVASVFFDPTMYARVASVTLTAGGTLSRVVLDFGPHYEELHGSSRRTFSAGECSAAKITIVTDQAAIESWNRPDPPTGRPFMETYNQLVAMRFADSEAFKRRTAWFDPDPETHFEALYPGYGARYADLWLHRCVLDKLPRAHRGVVRVGRDMSSARIVGRIRRALEHARSVVPARVLEALSTRAVNTAVADEDDEEQGEVALENEQRGLYVGYPDTWYIPWNKVR